MDKFYETILPILEGIDSDYELIFVKDGSRDASPAILDRLAMDSKKVKVIHFSRNYGHEAAMIAGIDYSSGDGIVCMDADLQHPVFYCHNKEASGSFKKTFSGNFTFSSCLCAKYWI